jgi:cytochrome c-type biogenesis protein CcmH/NrfG
LQRKVSASREIALALFWLLAGVMVTLAALVVLLPWIRTIERLGPLPAIPWQGTVGAAVIVAVVVGLYWKWGRPDLLGDRRSPAVAIAPGRSAVGAPPAAGPNASQGMGGGSMNSAIASLERRLAQGGGSADDWELLAKSYDFLGQPENAAKARARQLPPVSADAASAPGAPSVTVAPPVTPKLAADSLQWLEKASAARREQRFADAAAIYAQLAARGQMSAEAWADYADTAASLQGKKLAGEPEKYIAKALALSPLDPKALWLKASADEEAGRFADAAASLQKLSGELDPKSADAKIVNASLQQDRKLAASSPNGPPTAVDATASSAAVSGQVSLAKSLLGKVAAGSILFVVAKSVDSPGIPVAVLRMPTGTWPVPFTLNDASAMIPGRTFSTAGRVTIEARISASGQAIPTSGDLQGSSQILAPGGHTAVKIVIDKVVK